MLLKLTNFFKSKQNWTKLIIWNKKITSEISGVNYKDPVLFNGSQSISGHSQMLHAKVKLHPFCLWDSKPNSIER